MAIAANFPSIKPSLSLDFANVGRLDPRVTFARASTARYYDGVTTAKAEENLLLRSQDYSTSWTVTNLTPVTGKTAPDGTSTATEFTAGAANAVLTQGYTAVAGSYTFSVWLRRVTGTGDIEIAADNGTWTTKVITGTWARYDVTQTVTAGSKTAGVRVVTSGDAIEVWGAQLEQRSAVTAYTATTTQPITNYIPVLLTAQNNEARFDHTPTTGAALGLLIEEQRTNLATYSEDFANAAWTKSNASIISNTIVAPDGTLTGDLLVNDTTSNSHFANQSFSKTAQSYTASIFIKKQNYRYVDLGFSGVANWDGLPQAKFDLEDGAVENVGTSATATIKDIGNGWYYCTLTSTSLNTTSSTITIAFSDNDVTRFPTFAGNDYSGGFIWGAQLEAGAFATSYIPTTTTALTRSADVASMTGTNFSSWFDAGEFTVVSSFQRDTTANAVSGGGNSVPRIYSFGTSASGALQLRLFSSTGAEAIGPSMYIASTWAAGQVVKHALAYAVNNAALVRDGGSAATDTSVDPFSTVPDMFSIGANTSGTGNIGQGWIQRIAYYPVKLSSAQLQALTG